MSYEHEKKNLIYAEKEKEKYENIYNFFNFIALCKELKQYDLNMK